MRRRLADEWRWVREAAKVGPDESVLLFSAHPRLIAQRGGQVWCWPTETVAEAVKLERELIEFCVLATSAPPRLNGRAWWSNSAAAVSLRGWWAEHRADRRARAA